ncbi:MAG: RNA 2'-phosphotransferase [Chthonomonadales bacterium]
MSLWLRHKPERAGLTLNPEGWVELSDLLVALESRELAVTAEDLEQIARQDAQHRFEVERGMIRARFGHTVDLGVAPHPGMPPKILYHGTQRRYVDDILANGLSPMKRQFVNLSPDKVLARLDGSRRAQPASLIQVDGHAAYEAGVKFYPRGKDVWMSDPIPAAYLTLGENPAKITTTSSRPPERNAARVAAPGEPRRRKPRGGFLKSKNGPKKPER